MITCTHSPQLAHTTTCDPLAWAQDEDQDLERQARQALMDMQVLDAHERADHAEGLHEDWPCGECPLCFLDSARDR